MEKRSTIKRLIDSPFENRNVPTKRKLESGEEIVEMNFKYIRFRWFF